MSVPTKVGPPPISPSSPRKRQEGRVSEPDSGATMPKPSVALCSPKPDDQHERERHLILRGGLTDGQPLGEVVQADARCDQQREPPGR